MSLRKGGTAVDWWFKLAVLFPESSVWQQQKTSTNLFDDATKKSLFHSNLCVIVFFLPLPCPIWSPHHRQIGQTLFFAQHSNSVVTSYWFRQAIVRGFIWKFLRQGGRFGVRSVGLTSLSFSQTTVASRPAWPSYTIGPTYVAVDTLTNPI